jgi:hypothetical protein
MPRRAAKEQQGARLMIPAKFKDFTELYRAAFAEADAEKKGMLLREVSKVIEQSAQEMREESLNNPQAA